MDRRHPARRGARFGELAEVDQWEAAHFKEEEIRSRAKAAKKEYEAALRLKFFGFR